MDFFYNGKFVVKTFKFTNTRKDDEGLARSFFNFKWDYGHSGRNIPST